MSTDKASRLKIDCSWQSNVDGLDIDNCVKTILETEQKIDGNIPFSDVMGLIDEFGCKFVNFTKSENENDQQMFINIHCTPKYLIRNVLMCSEAKIIELYGETGEYVSTHTAIHVRELEEYELYTHLIHMNSNRCSLKLEQLNNSDFVWVFGIFVILTESKEDSCKSLGPINMQNVKHLLDPNSLAINAQKLFSSLSLTKESKPDNHIFNSFLSHLENARFPDSNDDSQSMLNNFKEFEKRVEDKLNSMALQVNTISDNVEILNKKFDTLLSALQEKISL